MEKKSQSLFFHLNYLSQIPKFEFQEQSDKVSQPNNIHRPNNNINFIESQTQSHTHQLALKNREQNQSFERNMKSPQIMTNTFVFNNSNINIQNNFYNEFQPTNNQKVHLVFPMTSQNTPSRPSTQTDNSGISSVFRRIKKAQLNQAQRSKSSLSKIYNSNNIQNNLNLNSYINPQQDNSNHDSHKLQNLMPNNKSPTSISASYRSVSFDYTGAKFQNRQKINNDNPKRPYQTIDQGSVQLKQSKQENFQQQNQFRSINIHDQSQKDNDSFAQYENYLNDSFFDKKKQSNQIQINMNKSLLQYQQSNHLQSLSQSRHPQSQQQSRNSSVAKRKYSSKSVSSNHNELAKVYGFNQKTTNINKPNQVIKQTQQQQQQQQQETLKARPPSTNQSRRSPLLRQRRYKQNHSIMCESPDYQKRNKIQIEQVPFTLSQNQNQLTPSEKNLVFSFNCDLNPNMSFQDALKDQLKTKHLKEESSTIGGQNSNSKFYLSSLDNAEEQKNLKQHLGIQKTNQNIDDKSFTKKQTQKQKEELSKTSAQENKNNLNQIQNKMTQNNQINFQKQTTKKIYQLLKNTKNNQKQQTNEDKVENDEFNVEIVQNVNEKNNKNQPIYKTLDSFLSQNRGAERNLDQINMKHSGYQNYQHFKRKYNASNKRTINLEEEKMKILQMVKQQNQNIYQNQAQINKLDNEHKNKIYLDKSQQEGHNKDKIENRMNISNNYLNQQENVNKIDNKIQFKKANKQKQYDLIGAESSVQDRQSISPKNSKNYIQQNQAYNIESQRNLVEDSIEKIDNQDKIKLNKIEDQIHVYYDKYLQESNGFQKIFKGKKCENDQESSQTRFSLAKIQIVGESQKDFKQNGLNHIIRQNSAQNNSQQISDNNSHLRGSQRRSQSVFQSNNSNRDIAIEFGFSNFHSIENSQALSANNSKENSPIPTPSLFEIQKRWAATNNNFNNNSNNNIIMKGDGFQNKKNVYGQKVFINNSQNNLDNYIPNLQQEQSIKRNIKVEDFESSLDNNSISLERKMQLQMRNIRDSYSSFGNQSDKQSQYTAIFQKADNQTSKFGNSNPFQFQQQHQNENAKKYNFYNEKNQNQILQFLEEPLETFGDVNKSPTYSNVEQI